jgi:two-component system cell cycle response regulator
MTKKIKELEKEIRYLRRLTIKDEITGVLNRRGFYEKASGFFNDVIFIKKKLNKQKRKNLLIKDFSILFIDIDNLKKVNDIYGHVAGDRVIDIVAKIASKSTRGTDFVCRWGGDEFIIGLTGSSENNGYKIAQKISREFKKNKKISMFKNTKLTLSIGVAEVNDPTFSLDDLIDKADKAMYEGKHRRGKNCIVKYGEIS